ncbi:hypothetical protein TTHERM_00752230 (macronuclear) [Tetrahymena thermophila SB210]|uniref:Kinase domain protein n=1 Tax=Tetrahymena thermophila (strain SB210) TaxID=312017 RepID=Q23NJ7_TETTS|nr:hypothetical protein TTHERM_00752230 [Tetrahymena thermophila SB210]EAR98077.2 hypothetical protein TTHERM_00752230 [Tetrahymena thermophila SB210]|eukprot:XP_001018322.2 hypothetical protein TTHERM_00752230 [Tetrahymena thermophila SB210]
MSQISNILAEKLSFSNNIKLQQVLNTQQFQLAETINCNKQNQPFMTDFSDPNQLVIQSNKYMLEKNYSEINFSTIKSTVIYIDENSILDVMFWSHHFSKLPNLRTLTLSIVELPREENYDFYLNQNQLHSLEIIKFAKSLSHLTSLQSFQISFENIVVTTAIWLSFWDSIRHLTQLKTFAISLTNVYCLQKKQLHPIANSVSSLQNLESLYINLKNLGNNFNPILGCFSQLAYVKNLNIQIIDQEFSLDKNLADLIFRMKELESLKIYLDLNIQSESFEYLGNCIGKQNELKVLNLQIGFENTQINLKNCLYFFKEINKISYLQFFDFNFFQYKQEMVEAIDEDDENSNQNTDTSQLLQLSSTELEELKKQKQQALQFSKELNELVKQKIIVNQKVKNMIYKQTQQKIYRKEIISESSLLSCLEKK